MNRWLEEVERASEALDPQWEAWAPDPEQGLEGVLGVAHRRARRRRAARGAAALVALAGVIALLWSARPQTTAPSAPERTTVESRTSESIRLQDGSVITPTPETKGCCVVREVSERRAVVVLERGQARFGHGLVFGHIGPPGGLTNSVRTKRPAWSRADATKCGEQVCAGITQVNRGEG